MQYVILKGEESKWRNFHNNSNKNLLKEDSGTVLELSGGVDTSSQSQYSSSGPLSKGYKPFSQNL